MLVRQLKSVCLSCPVIDFLKAQPWESVRLHTKLGDDVSFCVGCYGVRVGVFNDPPRPISSPGCRFTLQHNILSRFMMWYMQCLLFPLLYLHLPLALSAPFDAPVVVPATVFPCTVLNSSYILSGPNPSQEVDRAE